MTLKVSDIGEKELVRYIIANSKEITPDDTAITKFNSTNLISTCDMLIQSRHFPKHMSYFDMGFKAVTVNVSDLAAMGAEPLGFLLAIALRPTAYPHPHHQQPRGGRCRRVDSLRYRSHHKRHTRV